MKRQLGGLLLALIAVPAIAQDKPEPTALDAVEITGSRIKTTQLEGQAPVLTLDRKYLDRSGVGSIGELLQQLTASGKGLNTKFNSSGNFGYPADGGGIGSGSTQVDLRHLEPKRVLVLVDGIRWVNESSASGVGGAVDLNTIPMAIVERIEVLEDGASAIYGSDAIAGVINIITRRDYHGASMNTYYGMYNKGDGQTGHADLAYGGQLLSGSNTVAVLSYFNQQDVAARDRALSRLPKPNTGNTRGSSATPQGRFIFCDARRTPNCNPATDYNDLALNEGVDTVNYNSNSPNAPPSTYHDFTTADRYNYAQENLVLTPNERASLFLSHQMDLTDEIRGYAKLLYNRRQSLNRAAPEPIFIGTDAGTGGIADTISIPANQPYNPFGIALNSGAGGNFSLLTRRPLEGGPRLFMQTVDTYYANAGARGVLDFARQSLSWDANFVYSDNRARQDFKNGYNTRRLQQALGDPAACAAIAGCVPLDLFHGQGSAHAGTITPAMLSFVRVDTQDRSDNQLMLFSGNVSGGLMALPDGTLSFASGYEFRRYQGSFTPDAQRIAGESQDSSAIPTSGKYDVHEVYGELSIPVLADRPYAKNLDFSTALRYSHYSTFGGKATGKLGFKYRPVEDVLLRGTYAQGFRAPFIGELYGLAQFGASITDPCSNSDGTPLQQNCRNLGVPAGYAQNNTQITTNTGGNPDLKPEKASSYTLGTVYSPGWAVALPFVRRLDAELTWYHHSIKNAVRAPDAQARLDACVDSGDPNSVFCQGISRTPSGQINRFNNLLANIGNFVTDGADLKLNWGAPEMALGKLGASWQTTWVHKYRATDALGTDFPQKEGAEANDGAIPRFTSNLQLDWSHDTWSAAWTVRYIGGVTEKCSDDGDNTPKSLANLGLCSSPNYVDNSASTNRLASTFYNDVQLSWDTPLAGHGLKLSAGVNNLLNQDPPTCYSCSLNGYDAGTYDAPGQFGYVEATFAF